MDVVLSTQDLCKKYRHTLALDHLTMQVPKGSIYGLVGRNGAGKTTLIRLICGLQAPTSGSYTLYGAQHGTSAIRQARQRMGAMVESPAIYQSLTAQDNLRMQYQVLGLPSDQDIPHLLDLVGLSHTGKKKVRHFSLGMRQRLGIAMALAGNPDFLVLDEPTNGLDPQGIVEMRELLLRLNREHQITILISRHILDELSRLATRYGFVDGGRMLRQVSAGDVERACRKCTHVEVSDTAALAYVGTSLMLTVALASIYTMLAMLIQNRAVSAVVALVLSFLLLLSGSYLYSYLNYPPFYTQVTYDPATGTMREEVTEYPYYPKGIKRTIYQLLCDVTPGGQVMQCVAWDAPNLPRLPLSSAVITVVTTGVGLWLFRRNDLK